MVDAHILCFCFSQFNALAGDPVCLTAVVLSLAMVESLWTNLLLPFILLTPGQLSLTAGVASADGWGVRSVVNSPFPLFDTGAGVDTGCHVGSATDKVSAFITRMIVARAVATLIKWESNAIGADGWPPLNTAINMR